MNKKLMIIIAAVVVVLLLVAAVVVVLVVRGPSEKPVVYYEFQLAEEYSNLADVDRPKIIKYRVTIEYTDADILTEIQKFETRIRNNVDEIMRSTQSEDLSKPNGKQRLRERIQNMVIDVLESNEEVITNIYIQPFVIQG